MHHIQKGTSRALARGESTRLCRSASAAHCTDPSLSLPPALAGAALRRPVPILAARHAVPTRDAPSRHARRSSRLAVQWHVAVWTDAPRTQTCQPARLAVSRVRAPWNLLGRAPLCTHSLPGRVGSRVPLHVLQQTCTCTCSGPPVAVKDTHACSRRARAHGACLLPCLLPFGASAEGPGAGPHPARGTTITTCGPALLPFYYMRMLLGTPRRNYNYVSGTIVPNPPGGRPGALPAVVYNGVGTTKDGRVWPNPLHA